MMTIREIKNDELDFLADMLYMAIFIPEGHDPLPKDIIKDKSLAKYIDQWGKDNYDIALVAESDRQLIGAIWGRLFSEENQGYGFIDTTTPELSMAIHPEFRAKGIGTELMRAIVAAYQKLGVEFLSLSVDKANKASGLYKRLGFEIIEETKTAWTMKKAIK